MTVNKTSRVELDSPSRKRIFNALESGKKSTHVSEFFDVPPTTCRNLFSRAKKRGTVHNAPRSGRPPKADDRTIRSLLRFALKNRRASLKEIGNSVEPKLSASTVRRILAKHGYHRRSARKTPHITRLQKQKRKRWAEEYWLWKMEDWRRVIWTDECYVVLGDKKGTVYVTRRADEEYAPECTVASFTQSSVKVMVWACIMEGAKGPIVVLDYPGGKGGGFNADRYQEQVLDGPFWDFYISMVDDRDYMYFMQDNAPCHKSRKIKRWFEGTWIPMLPHPPKSPDVNPLENIWHILKDRIRARPHPPTSISELKLAVREAWESITIEEINLHVHSMPKRVEAVFEANGGNTKY